MILRVSILICFCGFVFVFCYKQAKSERFDPEKIAIELQNDKRYLSTEEISDIIINEDPSYQLVDLRPADEFILERKIGQ